MPSSILRTSITSRLASAFILLCSIFLGIAQADSPQGTPEQRLVLQLGDDSFHTRQRAQNSILSIGPTEAIKSALQLGSLSESVEIRLSSQRIIARFELAIFDQQIQYLLNPRIASDSITLTGWARFSKLVGTKMSTRRAFATLAKRYSHLLENFESNPESILQHFGTQSLDPRVIGKNDLSRWILILFLDTETKPVYKSPMSFRILNALSHSGLCPHTKTQDEQQLLSSLINAWLVSHKHVGSDQDRLVIAVRYQCQSTAHKLCKKILQSNQSTPTALATGLLAGHALKIENMNRYLISGCDDSRTSHVWQLIASRQTRVKTQVRDVAVAILLHRNGHDPREFGFIEVQADPILMYRDHSLGFRDNLSREKTHLQARAALGF